MADRWCVGAAKCLLGFAGMSVEDLVRRGEGLSGWGWAWAEVEGEDESTCQRRRPQFFLLLFY